MPAGEDSDVDEEGSVSTSDCDAHILFICFLMFNVPAGDDSDADKEAARQPQTHKQARALLLFLVVVHVFSSLICKLQHKLLFRLTNRHVQHWYYIHCTFNVIHAIVDRRIPCLHFRRSRAYASCRCHALTRKCFAIT